MEDFKLIAGIILGGGDRLYTRNNYIQFAYIGGEPPILIPDYHFKVLQANGKLEGFGQDIGEQIDIINIDIEGTGTTYTFPQDSELYTCYVYLEATSPPLGSALTVNVYDTSRAGNPSILDTLLTIPAGQTRSLPNILVIPNFNAGAVLQISVISVGSESPGAGVKLILGRKYNEGETFDWERVGLVNTGNGYTAILQNTKSYMFADTKKINIYSLNADESPLDWKGGSFIRTTETIGASSVNVISTSGAENEKYFGWGFVSPETGTNNQQFFDAIAFNYLPNNSLIHRRYGINQKNYNLLDTYFLFDVNQSVTLIPEFYQTINLYEMPSAVTPFATSGTYINVYGSANPSYILNSTSGGVSFTIKKQSGDRNWTYNISNSYSATHTSTEGSAYGTGSNQWDQSLEISYSANYFTPIKLSVISGSGKTTINGYASESSSINETNTFTGDLSTSLSTGTVGTQGRSVNASGNTYLETRYTLSITTKGVTKTVDWVSSTNSSISKSGSQILNINNGLPSSGDGVAERTTVTDKTFPSLIIESDDCCWLAISRQQLTERIKISYVTDEYDVVGDITLRTKELNLIVGNNTYATQEDNLSFYIYARITVSDLTKGGTLNIGSPDYMQVGIDEGHWKNKTYVTESKRSRNTRNGSGAVQSSSTKENECKLLDINGATVDVVVKYGGEYSFYRGVINITATEESKTVYSVDYTQYPSWGLNLSVAITDKIEDYGFHCSEYIRQDIDDYVILFSTDDSTCLLLNLFRLSPLTTRQSNFYTVVDKQSGEVIELAISEQKPSNNNFGGAVLLEGQNVSVRGNNYGADQQSNDSEPELSSPTQSVWYKWVAPSSTPVTIHTLGSPVAADYQVDTVIGVYTGSSLDSLSLVASNDDASVELPPNGDYLSAVVINPTEGTTYYIQVDGWSDTQWSFVLSITTEGLNVPTPIQEETRWADIYRFDTQTLKWKRMPNAVSAISPLTAESDFISYHPTPQTETLDGTICPEE